MEERKEEIKEKIDKLVEKIIEVDIERNRARQKLKNILEYIGEAVGKKKYKNISKLWQKIGEERGRVYRLVIYTNDRMAVIEEMDEEEYYNSTYSEWKERDVENIEPHGVVMILEKIVCAIDDIMIQYADNEIEKARGADSDRGNERNGKKGLPLFQNTGDC